MAGKLATDAALARIPGRCRRKRTRAGNAPGNLVVQMSGLILGLVGTLGHTSSVSATCHTFSPIPSNYSQIIHFLVMNLPKDYKVEMLVNITSSNVEEPCNNLWKLSYYKETLLKLQQKSNQGTALYNQTEILVQSLSFLNATLQAGEHNCVEWRWRWQKTFFQELQNSLDVLHNDPASHCILDKIFDHILVCTELKCNQQVRKAKRKHSYRKWRRKCKWKPNKTSAQAKALAAFEEDECGRCTVNIILAVLTGTAGLFLGSVAGCSVGRKVTLHRLQVPHVFSATSSCHQHDGRSSPYVGDEMLR
uniref:uncharacterized protein isoform X2 n=1 Tax=Myxine glutinosa TaxID=7769 RepID=UPI00358F2289